MSSKLYWSGNDLYESILSFGEKSESISLFIAYIKKDALLRIVSSARNVKLVCVRWNINDIRSGASDIDIYPLLRERGIPLYHNRRLHIKAYLSKEGSAYLTSANMSERALGFLPNCNHEIGTIVDHVANKDILSFERIISESIYVDDDYFAFMNQYASESKVAISEEEELLYDDTNQQFLISSLPMSRDVFVLYASYSIDFNSKSTEERDCAIHDTALYRLELGLTRGEFYKILKTRFFEHKFIVALVAEIDRNGGAIYFGSAKEWVQNNCTSVPTPRRWELTENVQILFNWIVNLGDGMYDVDVPGRHSQRLYKVK